jgi:hypothetical protein
MNYPAASSGYLEYSDEEGSQQAAGNESPQALFFIIAPLRFSLRSSSVSAEPR